MNDCKVATAAAAFLITAFTTPAAAQDSCADVLRQGTFQTTNIRENSYFQQIIWSRFLSSTFQESKTDKNLGFGVPVGEIVLGGNYDETTFKQKKADIRKEFSNNITSTNEIDVALASGDPAIVSAWSNCMKSKGGYISLTFQPVSAKQIFARIKWEPGAAGSSTGVAETKLEDDLVLPAGASFSSGASCFTKGKVLRSVAPCVATINLPSAEQDLAISLNAEHGSVTAYLPPRMKLIRETLPFSFAGPYRATAFRQQYRAPFSVSLSADQIAAGWRFDSLSAQVKLKEVSRGHWVHSCLDPQTRSDLYTVSFDFEIFASGKNSPERNTSMVCDIIPSINITRDRWVPIDEKV